MSDERMSAEDVRIEKFAKMIKRLGDHFVPLDEDKVDLYYSRLKYVDMTTLLKAGDALIDQHPYRRFPLMAEFWKAIAAVKRTQAFREYEADRAAQIGVCAKCRGEGVYTEKDVFFPEVGYTADIARFCECSRGQRRLEATARLMQTKEQEPGRVSLQYKDEPTIIGADE